MIDFKILKIQERAQTIGEYVELVYTEVLLPNFPHHPIMRDEKFRRRLLRTRHHGRTQNDGRQQDKEDIFKIHRFIQHIAF